MSAVNQWIKDLRKQVADGGDPHEVVDSFVNTSLDLDLQAVLEDKGEVDLSEPLPDLKEGWSSVRRQLAFNALYHHVTRTQP